jgi:hypothetical protein
MARTTPAGSSDSGRFLTGSRVPTYCLDEAPPLAVRPRLISLLAFGLWIGGRVFESVRAPSPCNGRRCRAYLSARFSRGRRGREAEGGGLLNRYRVVKLYPGFESLRLRQPIDLHRNFVFDRRRTGGTKGQRRGEFRANWQPGAEASSLSSPMAASMARQRRTGRRGRTGGPWSRPDCNGRGGARP